MRVRLLAGMLWAFAVVSFAQSPALFHASDIDVGARSTPTRYLYALGKWSGAGEHIGALSTEIHCYRSLGFCQVASADWNGMEANVKLTTFEILRWDGREITAMDDSQICVVKTLRADLINQRVTLGSADRSVQNNSVCKATKSATVELLGEVDVRREEAEKAGRKK